MKKSRFTDSQIIEALKRAEAKFAIANERRVTQRAYLVFKRGATPELASINDQ